MSDNDVETYFNVRATAIGVVFGVVGLSIIIWTARWIMLKNRPVPAGGAPRADIPLATAPRRTRWITNRRQDTARSEDLPAYGDTQNTTIVRPGDPRYRAPADGLTAEALGAGSLLDFSGNLSIGDRIQKAQSILAQLKLIASGSPDGGYPAGSLEALRFVELQRAMGLLLSVDAEKAPASAHPEDGETVPAPPSPEGARESTTATQRHSGVIGEVEMLLGRIESLLPPGGTEPDESSQAKIQELRRRIVDLIAVDDPIPKELPPQYITAPETPANDTRPTADDHANPRL